MSNFNPHSHHRTTDPNTSKVAAKRAGRFANSHKQRCFRVLKIDGESTQSQIASASGLSREQVHKRLSDLKNDGLIMDSGRRRAGATGSLETVWTVV